VRQEREMLEDWSGLVPLPVQSRIRRFGQEL